MRLPEPPRPRRRETILPMINVVFLLLIFFLLAARLAPPDPFAVAVPETTDGEAAEAPLVLYLSAEGQLGFRDVLGEAAALAALEDALEPSDVEAQVLLRADRAVSGARLAALLPKLSTLGLRVVLLVTAPK